MERLTKILCDLKMSLSMREFVMVDTSLRSHDEANPHRRKALALLAKSTIGLTVIAAATVAYPLATANPARSENCCSRCVRSRSRNCAIQ